MRTSNEHQKDRADAGGPQPGAGEDRTAEATVASRVVTREQTRRTPQDREQLDSFAPVGEDVHSRPGKKGNAVPIYVPRPCAAASAQAAIIDWLAFTVRLSDHYHMAQLLADIQRFFKVSRTADCDYGWNGYTRRTMLGEFGLVAWGGKSQNDTAYVSLNAHGCAMASDWAGIEAWIAGLQAKISRIDLAHDDFTGEVWNIERLRAEYLGDGFSGANGRKASSMLIGDYDNLDKGRTYQIGSRAAGKLLRGYEKGKQLGDPDSPWFRVELELLAKNRLIPWEILTQPGRYLAGAYPCLATLSESPERIPTSIKAAGVEYDALIGHVRRQYGQAINLIYHVEKRDADRVFKKIMRGGFPQRFVPLLPFLLRGGSHEDADAI
ncbi:replication initiation factor domain-containing protein [Azonexus hydrophilus]|uniref:Replication initiation factor domain-containing protein n=1 Tax=Azonexus hydrophilus TaxID=418702 RepID=A0ABZ2XL37_9RHOO